MQVRSKGMVEVLQFKATVWPKVAPDQAWKLKNFVGEHPPDPPSCFGISVLLVAESWAGPGYEATRKHNVPMVCPGIGCALATPLEYCGVTKLSTFFI